MTAPTPPTPLITDIFGPPPLQEHTLHFYQSRDGWLLFAEAPATLHAGPRPNITLRAIIRRGMSTARISTELTTDPMGGDTRASYDRRLTPVGHNQINPGVLDQLIEALAAVMRPAYHLDALTLTDAGAIRPRLNPKTPRT